MTTVDCDFDEAEMCAFFGHQCKSNLGKRTQTCLLSQSPGGGQVQLCTSCFNFNGWLQNWLADFLSNN
ncbi:hypothetical protein T05_536 [Trichinella murrelli]|uniref:Uncharacterized protein n=1 Tax=Trichinella murrelli TaxID=144512 RepID=A0A0V0UGP1_9BILA|nr:hypothetical protein T05_536 [Trichinella murrelli]